MASTFKCPLGTCKDVFKTTEIGFKRHLNSKHQGCRIDEKQLQESNMIQCKSCGYYEWIKKGLSCFKCKSILSDIVPSQVEKGKFSEPNEEFRDKDNSSISKNSAISSLTVTSNSSVEKARQIRTKQNHITVIDSPLVSRPTLSNSILSESEEGPLLYSGSHICQICSFETKHEQDLQSHYNDNHRKVVESFCCSICRKECSKLQAFREHLQEHSIGQLKVLPDSFWKRYNLFLCEKCNVPLRTKTNHKCVPARNSPLSIVIKPIYSLIDSPQASNSSSRDSNFLQESIRDNCASLQDVPLITLPSQACNICSYESKSYEDFQFHYNTIH